MNAQEIFGIHLEAVRVRGQRAQVLARNMANADTPGYKARDFDFQQLLTSQSADGSRLRRTHTGHLTANGDTAVDADLGYRIPQQPSLDGNTVDMQVERAEFMRNALMYQTSLQFLNGRIKGLMTAIRGE